MSTDVDLANLLVKVDATDIETGARPALRGMVADGANAEKAMADLGKTSKEAAGKVSEIGKSATGVKSIDNALSAAASASAKFNTNARGAASAASEMAEQIRAADRALADEAKVARDVANGMSAAQAATLRYKLATQDLNSHVEAYNAHAKKMSDSSKKAGDQILITRHQLMDLSFQLNDIITTLLSGGNAFQAFGQQGGQIFQNLQTGPKGLKGSLQGLFALIPAGTGLLLGLAAAAATVGVAMLQGESDANKFSNAIRATGGYAGITAVQYEQAARQIADSTGRGLGEARTTMLALIDTGKFTGDTIRLLAQDIVKLADYTGKTSAEVTASFASMGRDVGDFAAKFNEQYHLLTFAQVEHIRLLTEQGETTQAQLELAIAIHRRLGEEGPKDLGYLEQAWRGVSSAIGSAWQALKDFGNEGASRASSIARLQAKITEAQSPNTVVPVGYDMDRYVAGLKAQLSVLQQQEAQSQKNAKAKADEATAENLAVQAAQRHRDVYATMGDNLAKANREIATYRREQDAIRRVDPHSRELDSVQRQAAIIADINKKYLPDQTAATKKQESAAEAAAKAAARHAEQLRIDAEAMEASTAGALNVAKAYEISGAAALRAAATAEATAKAIKAKGDIDAYVQRQLDFNAAKASAQAAQTIYDLNAQSAAVEGMNALVAAGFVTQTEANQLLKDGAALRALEAQRDAASGDVKEQLTKQIGQLTDAQIRSAQAVRATAINAQVTGLQDQNELIAAQVRLLDAANHQRVRQLAILQKEAELRSQGLDKEPGAAGIITQAGQTAVDASDLAVSQDLYNQSLTRTSDLLATIAARTQSAGQGLADAFGKGGQAVADLSNAIAGLAARQEAIRTDQAAKTRAATVSETASEAQRIASARAIQDINIAAANAQRDAQVDSYADMAGAAQSFFKEGSKGYDVLGRAEKAFRILQFALSAQAIIQKATEAAATVASHGAMTASGIAAGAANIFASLGPLGFPVVAAMLAVMAGLGAKGGGGAAPGSADIENRQKSQGTGTVLGSPDAQSESLQRALQTVAAYTNKDLEYSNSMLSALRSIDSQIGVVASAVARNLGVGGQLDTSALNLGTTTSGPGLLTKLFAPISAILPGLFGKKTTTTLQDQGIQFDSQTLGEILNGGLSGDAYQQVLTQTKKKAFGITYSNKTKSSTSTSDLDAELTNQITLLLGSLKQGVLSAAGVLGVTGADAVLSSFQVELGKISFKDMDADQITATLNAVFGKVADQMASSVIPGLSALQKAGEGTFETLARVAREYQVVDVTMASIGKTFGLVGVSSLAARDRLVQAAGGLDEFTSQASFFAENFLTEAEQLAPVQKAVTLEMARLGLAGVQTKDQFKALVLGLDVTTKEGAELYTALMAVAPAFAKVADAAAAAGNGVKSLAEQIAEAVGSAMTLIDDQINASSSAASAAKASAANYRSLAKSLQESIASLRGGDLSTLSPGQKLAESRAGLDVLFNQALSGDAGALAKLPQTANDFLAASKDYNASSAAYGADFQRVMDMLAQAGVAANADAGIMDYQATLLDIQTGVLKEIRDNLKGPSPDTVLLTQQASLLATIGTLLQDQTTQLVTVNSSLRDQNGNIIQGNAIVSAQTGQLVAVQSQSTLSVIGAQVNAVAQTIASQQATTAAAIAANDNGVTRLTGSTAAQTSTLQAAQASAAAQVGAAQANAAGQVVAGVMTNASQVVGATTTQTASLTSAQTSATNQVSAAQATAAGQIVGAQTTAQNAITAAQQLLGVNVGGYLSQQTGSLVGSNAATAGQIVGAQGQAATTIANSQAVAGSSVGSVIAQQTGLINAGQSQTAGQIVLSQTGLGSLLTAGNQTAANQLGLTQVGNLLINTQTGAITTLDGHTVTGNTLIDAQTGAVTSITGAVKDQTGAVLTGNKASDAIRNINALNNQYTEAMLNELAGAGVTQDSSFSDLLASNNVMVGLLQQIRDLTAAKATADQQAAAAAAAQATIAAQAAAQAQAAAAAQAAADAAAAAAQTAAKQPNWSSYLTSNPDVLAEYQRLSPNYLKTLGVYTAEQFAQWHYDHFGKSEGRAPYALGAIFTNGIVTQPTTFHNSEMGEKGPEAIVPLVRGPEGLGVRTSGGDSKAQAEMISLLRAIRAELQADKGQRGAAAKAANDKLDTLIETMESTKRVAARRTAS